MKCLIDVRLRYEPEFQAGKKTKSTLWGKVWTDIKNVDNDFPFSKEELKRKFLNLVITYKRIKARNGKSGRSSTCWEYFEQFDAHYGCKHAIATPREDLISSLDETSINVGPSMESLEVDEGNIEVDEVNVQAGSSSRTKRRRTESNDILEFLKEESKKDAERHNELVSIERERLKIEMERVQELRGLKDLLQKHL